MLFDRKKIFGTDKVKLFKEKIPNKLDGENYK